MKHPELIALPVTWLLFTSSVLATDCDSRWRVLLDSDLETNTAVYQLYDIGCLGGSEDQTRWVRDVWNMFGEPLPDDGSEKYTEIKSRTSEAARLLLEQARNFDGIASALVPAIEAVMSQVPLDVSIRGVTSPIKWELQSDFSVSIAPDFQLADAISTCNSNPESCPGVQSSIRLIRLMQMALTQHADPVVEAYSARYTRRTSQWEAYLDTALPQYQWEWYFNGRRMKAKDKRPKDAEGDRMGPPEIPTSQLIVLHPAVGFEWIDPSDLSEEVSPSVYIEIFGLNRWKWSEEGKMKGGLGASIIAAYSTLGNTDEFSYGLMFHFQSKYSLAVTSNNGDVGILLGIDLANFYRGKLNEWNKNTETFDSLDIW